MERLSLGLLTYLLHSTVLLGAAALLRWGLRERRLALQEAVLRAALVGGVVTASLQVGLGVRPLGGVLEMPARPAVALWGAGSRLGPVDAAEPRPVRPASVEPSRAASLGPSRVDSPGGTEARSFGVWADAAGRLWRPGLAAGWGVLALLALVRLGVAARRLRSLLRDRRPLEQRDLGWQTLAVAAGLGLRRPLRVSAAPRLVVPLATGVLRPEVCLPRRVLEELPAEERTALCAHELAHVARRDPAWILLARLIEALAPVQPLNWWARRRLQDLAECLSDDLAVAASAGPLSLARSLVDVACWAMVGNPVPPALAAGALSAHSHLGHRVERLMDPLRAIERPCRFLLPLAAVAVVATALVTPVVSGSAVRETKTPAVAPQATPQPAALATVAVAPTAPVTPVVSASAVQETKTPAAAPQATPQPTALATPQRSEVGGVEGGLSDDRRRSEAERELERLAEKIERRSHQHEAEMKRLEAEIEALASKIQPNQQELERLSHQMEGAARQLADLLAAERAQGHTEKDSEKLAAARRQMEELQAGMQAKAGSIRLPEEEMRQIREKARALAELAKPSEQEMRELQRAAAESMPYAVEMSRSTGWAIEQAREQVHRAQEEVRRATAELRRAVEEARRAEQEARRAKRPERP